jgi:hypothetical protein
MKFIKLLFGALTIVWGILGQAQAQSFLTNGLVAYYPFSGNANDASGNGNNGIVAGAVLTTDRFNQPSSAYYFNWTNYSIGIPAFFDAGQANYTISLWFNTSSTQPVNQQLVASCPNPTLELEYNDTLNGSQGYVNYSIGTGTDWIQPTQRHGSKNDYQANTWYQVALVKQGSQFTLYIDGNFDETSSAAVPATGLIGFELGIGCASSTSTLTPGSNGGILGKMDEVRFYNRALSASEVQQLYVLESGNVCVPRRATATVTLDHGFVVAATVTDGGCGYTNTPLVLIQGGGGTGAQGVAVVSNGVVVGITLTDAGVGYTNAPNIYIYSPLGLQIGLLKAVKPTFSDLFIGTNYQLQISTDLNAWINSGSIFQATNTTMNYSQYFDVDNWSKLFFRLQVSP